jgi:hypothetical protein
MRRTNWKTVSTLITMVIVGGCTDSTIVEPTATSSGAPVSMAMAPEGRPSLSLAGATASNGTATFTVGPNGGVFFVGSNAVVFPANSICDPSVSSYGIGTWEDSCTPLTAPITITAETRVTNGKTQVDFSPSLRFVPSSSPSRWVWLYMRTPSLAGTTDLSQFTIFYAPTLTGPLVDESIADASLRTYVSTQSGTSLRRVKHFSGYVVSTGRCTTPNADPTLNDPASVTTTPCEPAPTDPPNTGTLP